jgi:hypothetical protein
MANLANQELWTRTPVEPHRLDAVSKSESVGTSPEFVPNSPTAVLAVPLPTKTKPQGRPQTPVKLWDIYVDDFIRMVQGSWRHLRHVKRVLLHVLDKIFLPLDQQDNEHRQESVSVKKRRCDVGHEEDYPGMDPRYRPTDHQGSRALDCAPVQSLDSVPPNQHCVSTKKWKQLVTESCSVVIAVPVGRGLCSVLQQVLAVRSKNGTRLRLASKVHTILRDFRLLATYLKERPTRISELVPSIVPATIGAQDATGNDMVGIHFVPLPDGVTPPALTSPLSDRSAGPPRVLRQPCQHHHQQLSGASR